MRTKIYLLLIALVATIGSLFGQSTVGTEFLDGGINYRVVSSTWQVEVIPSASPYIGEIRIPSIVTDGSNNYAVVGIGRQAFKDAEDVTLIEVPQGVTYLDYEAFRNCVNLSSISIPATVQRIDSYVFAGCSKLYSFGLDANNPFFKVTTNGSLLTEDGETLVSSLLTSHGVSYTIPSGVKTLITGAIAGAPNVYNAMLNSLIIPSSVETIEAGAIIDNLSLAEVIVSPENLNYKSLDGVLFSKDEKELIYYPAARNATSYVVPSGVEELIRMSFAWAANLSDISLPESLRTIGDLAFFRCEALKGLVIPSGVTAINNYAFQRSGLVNIVVPDNVVHLGTGVFYECADLNFLALGKNIELNDPSLFGRCRELETLVLSNPNPTVFHPDLIPGEVRGTIQIIIPEGSESAYNAIIPASIMTPSIIGYAIVFDSKGGSYVLSQYSETGVPTTKPSDPIMTGYSFDKWLNSSDDTEWDFTTPVVENIELYATYVANQYDITLNPNGGSVSPGAIENVVYGTSIGTLPTPRRTNHTFDGWFDSDGNEYNSGDIFAPAVPDNFVLIASWTLVARTQYTVTINPLTGVRVNKTSTTIGEGNSFGFTAEAIASGYSVNVSVNGSPLSAISGINYLIEDIRENKTITFSLVRGGTTPNPNPDTDPVAPGDGDSTIPGPGTPGGPGQVIIDENTPSDLGKLPGDGQIIVRPPLVDPNSPTPPKVIIDGKEVDGTWTTTRMVTRFS